MADEYGIEVSKPTLDVRAGNDRDKTFSSRYVHPKMYEIKRIIGTSEEHPHPFNYPPSFNGYLNTPNTDKFFVHYALGYYQGYQFEKGASTTGSIKADYQKLYLSCSAANELVVLSYVDPGVQRPDQFIEGASQPTREEYGIRISRDQSNAGTGFGYQMSITSEFQTFSIVQQGTLTVTLPAMNTSTPGTDQVDQTAFADANHSLGYPGHVVVFNEQANGNIRHFPGVIGISPPLVYTDTEVYVDSQKVRFRVSRSAIALSGVFDAFADEVTYRMKYYLTNFNLDRV